MEQPSSSLYRPITLGPLQLKGNIMLAPMAGYTDLSYRPLALQQGAALAFTELVSTEGLRRQSSKTELLMRRGLDEKDLAIQLFGANLQSIEQALPYALAYQPAVIDFNCGCPVPKVNKSGGGSALMQHPALIGQIIKLLRTHCPANVAVTVKFRTGWDSSSLNYLTVAEQALSNGANMITMHARTRAQGYSGLADWSHLTNLKKYFPSAIVCGSGDLFTPENIQQMLQTTAIDAVMIARGAIGNPFIFKQSIDLLTTGSYLATSNTEKIATALQHFKLALNYFNEQQAVRESKKHLMSYVKGLQGAAALKQGIALATNKEEILKLLTTSQQNNISNC